MSGVDILWVSQSLLEYLIPQNRLEEGVYHLRHQPNFRYVFERVHTNSNSLLGDRHYRLVGRAHLINVHDECGEQAVHTAFAVSNVSQGCVHSSMMFVLHESGCKPQLVVGLQRLNY